MWGMARFFEVNVQRAWMSVASVANRTQSPADCRLRFQTGGRTKASALAGRRSKSAFVSDHPFPSTPRSRTSYQRVFPPGSPFARAGSSTPSAATAPAQADHAIQAPTNQLERRAFIGQIPMVLGEDFE